MKENLGHLMLDIETMANGSNSALLSLGAVEFDIRTGKIGRIFYEKCTLQSNIDVGLKINGENVKWWMEQSIEARNEVMSGEQHLSNMLRNFTFFLEDIGTAELQLWGNSNRFDLGILEDAYNAVNKKIPWKYTLERDVRTLVSFYPDYKYNEIFTGVPHKSVDDCLHQIKYCVKIWNKLMTSEK